MGLLDSESGKRRLLSVEIPVIEQYNRTHAQLQERRTQQKKLAGQLQPLQLQVDVALSNSFGFGGHNVTLAVRRVA